MYVVVHKSRGIYFEKYYGWGGDGAGKKMKNEAVRNKNEKEGKREKEKEKKGRVIFYGTQFCVY